MGLGLPRRKAPRNKNPRIRRRHIMACTVSSGKRTASKALPASQIPYKSHGRPFRPGGYMVNLRRHDGRGPRRVGRGPEPNPAHRGHPAALHHSPQMLREALLIERPMKARPGQPHRGQAGARPKSCGGGPSGGPGGHRAGGPGPHFALAR